MLGSCRAKQRGTPKKHMREPPVLLRCARRVASLRRAGGGGLSTSGQAHHSMRRAVPLLPCDGPGALTSAVRERGVRPFPRARPWQPVASVLASLWVMVGVAISVHDRRWGRWLGAPRHQGQWSGAWNKSRNRGPTPRAGVVPPVAPAGGGCACSSTCIGTKGSWAKPTPRGFLAWPATGSGSPHETRESFGCVSYRPGYLVAMRRRIKSSKRLPPPVPVVCPVRQLHVSHTCHDASRAGPVNKL